MAAAAGTVETTQQAPEVELQSRIDALQSGLKDYMTNQKDVLKEMVATLTQIQKLVTKTVRMKSKGRRRNTTPQQYRLATKDAKTLSKLGLSGDVFSRSQVMKAVSAYIREHNLQNPDKKSVWVADAGISKVLDVKKGSENSYLQINKLITPFFKDAEKVATESS